MFKMNLLRAFIIGPLVSLSLFTAFASAAHAQSYDDDGNRILTPTEVYAALTKIERIENAMRAYAVEGLDAETLVGAPNAFDLESPGQRPDVVEVIKNSDPANPPRAAYTMLRIREGDRFHSVEEWDVTNVKGKDGKIHRLAKLDLKNSMFNDANFEDFLRDNNPKALAAAYKAGKIEVTENEPFTIADSYYINDLTKAAPQRATVAYVIAQGLTPDDRGTLVQRNAAASYYGRTCRNDAVTGSSFAPSSTFAAQARGYAFSCKEGLVQSAADGSLRIWFPGDEKPAAPAKPARP